MWIVDFPTLVLIIAAGFHVGLQAAFGVDAVGSIFGSYEKAVLIFMGLSALWQVSRQRFH